MSTRRTAATAQNSPLTRLGLRLGDAPRNSLIFVVAVGFAVVLWVAAEWGATAELIGFGVLTVLLFLDLALILLSDFAASDAGDTVEAD